MWLKWEIPSFLPSFLSLLSPLLHADKSELPHTRHLERGIEAKLFDLRREGKRLLRLRQDALASQVCIGQVTGLDWIGMTL